MFEKIKEWARSFLKIIPPEQYTFTIQSEFDEQTEAFKNKLWYDGNAYELEQFYKQTVNHTYCFWGAVPSKGREIRKIHTGLPHIIVDTLTGIVTADLNNISLKSKTDEEIWNEIANENNIKQLVSEAVKSALVIGDGAFKLSLDSKLSKYPIIEFISGDKVSFKYERGRLEEIIFLKEYKKRSAEYRLEEIYGKGYVKYKLFKGNSEIKLSEFEETKELAEVVYSGDFIMAVPFIISPSTKIKGRGKSIYDGKIDNFDSLDEAYSQWIHALRECRPTRYIPEVLAPRDFNTGAVIRPNPFDNQYVKIGDNMGEDARNTVDLKQPVLPVDAYLQTYITALDLCLQGIISPSTLGIDTKKIDNAEAQREKEKTTLYTRQMIINALTQTLKALVQSVFDTFNTAQEQPIYEVECDVIFGEYANPSFEAVVETLSNPNTPMSIEAKVEEMWGSTKSEEWKAEEIKRIKEQTGIMTADEPAIDAEFKVGGFIDG